VQAGEIRAGRHDGEPVADVGPSVPVISVSTLSAVVAVNTITSDLVPTQPDQVTHYQRLYHHLRVAALTTVDSLDFLAKVAQEL
jgi:hypothetical protein